MNRPKNIDEYIIGFPERTQELLEQIRTLVGKIVPEAEETISYGIPSFNLNGRYLIYFGGYKKHIGMYPVPLGKEFENAYSNYKTSGKGTIQFPLTQDIPSKLVTKIIKYRVKEVLNESR